MPNNIINRVRHAWNAFADKSPTSSYVMYGAGSYHNPDRVRLSRGNERSIVTSVYNRIAMDVAAIDFRHVKLDESGRYVEDINSPLNNCLTLEANIDQTARHFIQDAVMTMLDKGTVALAPIDTSSNPRTGSFDVYTVRVAEITQWYPREVELDVYNDQTGQHEQLKMDKAIVPIIENPFSAIMNEPNSTVRRLVRKLDLLDVIDEQSGSGKLDMIIQLPYVIKNEQQRATAERRRKDVEAQLKESKYGIAYTDGTERITQLNRPVENNMMHQIEYLYDLFYSQMGMTREIMNGSANEETMLNYYTRSIEPIVDAFAVNMKRKWLTKTARTQHQSIEYFRDPFKLVPVTQIADIGDKMTRNEIMSSNEMRQVIGLKPSKDPKADELRNKNLNAPPEEQQDANPAPEIKEENQNGE